MVDCSAQLLPLDFNPPVEVYPCFVQGWPELRLLGKHVKARVVDGVGEKGATKYDCQAFGNMFVKAHGSGGRRLL